MNARAKFRCTAVEKRMHWDAACPIVYAAKFDAVMNGSEENTKFWEASPSGHIELSTVRSDFFEVGAEYYIDFTIVVPQNAVPA